MVQNKVLIPPLKALQAFEQVAYFGSVVKAAESLNITTSAISHQIANLEILLNKKLFYRTGRGIVLTGTGEKYLEQISGALHSIGIATNNIIEKQEKETLNIHTSPAFGNLYLLPRIKKFQTLFPELQINFTCSYENVQFNLERVDIDIRHGYFSWKNLNVISIKNEYATVFANPNLIVQHPISHPRDLLKHNLILSQSTLIQWPQWFSYHNVNTLKGLQFLFSFDRSYMSYEAAKQELGFILENSLLAEQYLQKGELTPVFDKEFSMPINAHYIVFPHSHKKYSRVKNFVEWLKEELKNSSFY
ncbi:LysR family transcriptional regulator [Rodentibacter sp. Ppn85]|nr:LysR family transcriptional regulator [Rodentibacter sp. Ppn85]